MTACTTGAVLRPAALSTPQAPSSALGELIEPGERAIEQWEAAPMAVKREIVRLLFAPGVLGVLSVARTADGTPRGGPVAPRVRLDGEPPVPRRK